MAELESILGTMDRINTEMKKVVHGPARERNQQIVALRQEFTAETGNLIGHLPSDERLLAKPDLFMEFQDRLASVRMMLANHQTRWSIQDIDARRDDYLTATESVHGKIADYLDWAKDSLRVA
jgi:hypothetical protein